MGTGKAIIRKSPSSSSSSPTSSPGPKKTISLKEASGGRSDIPARDVLGREVKSTKISLKTARSRTMQSVQELPSLKDQQTAAKIVGVAPELAVHLTRYDIANILGSRSMAIKSEQAKKMYTDILKAREEKGVTPRVTGTQDAAIVRMAKREEQLQKHLAETPVLDIKGKEIPRFGAVIKNGEVVGTGIIGRQGAQGFKSGGYYYSRKSYLDAQAITKIANTNITPRMNASEKKRIQEARKLVLKSLEGQAVVDTLRYFNKLDMNVPTQASAFIPTSQENAYVTEKLVRAGIIALAGTKYTEAQKRQIVKTKLMRTPIKEDFKRDWAKLDALVSKKLNLPTESEMVAHRDRTFGKIPGFTKYQRDFAKRMNTPRYFYGVNISVEKGFMDYSRARYEKMRTRPATFGAEMAAMFIGAYYLAGLTVGGSIITKAGLRKLAAMSTNKIVKGGLQLAVKHLDKMVALGYMTPIAAQAITASWEDKFNLAEGVLIGGAGFAKGTAAAKRYFKLSLSTVSPKKKDLVSVAAFKRFMKNEEATLLPEKKLTDAELDAMFEQFREKTKKESGTVEERVKKAQQETVKTTKTIKPVEEAVTVSGIVSAMSKDIYKKSRDMGDFFEQSEEFSVSKDPTTLKVKEAAKVKPIDEKTIKILKSQGLIPEHITEPTKGWRGHSDLKPPRPKEIELEIFKPRINEVDTFEREEAALLKDMDEIIKQAKIESEEAAIIKETEDIIKLERFEREEAALLKDMDEIILRHQKLKRVKEIREIEKEIPPKQKKLTRTKTIPVSLQREREREKEIVNEKVNEILTDVAVSVEAVRSTVKQIVSEKQKEETREKQKEREIEKETERTKEKEKEKTKEKEKEKTKEKEKVKDIPVIPILSAYQIRMKRKKEQKEVKIIVTTITRTITNQLGDIRSILG